jgi:hypothetical protein
VVYKGKNSVIDLRAFVNAITQAVEHGNTDAQDRLNALSQPAPHSLSRAEHEQLTDSKLVRTRTQAKQRSDATGARRPTLPQEQGARIMENVRKNSVMITPQVAAQSARYNSPMTQEPQPPRQQVSSKPTTPAPAQAQAQAQSQSPRPFANAPRYNLSDPGSGSATSPRPPPSQTSFGPPRREGRPSLDNRPDAATPPVGINSDNGPPRKGPATFAEMGITTAKVEEKECIIM